MAKYSFHKGLKANLPSAGLVEGRYYQCTDTGELYLATSTNTKVLVAVGDAPIDDKQYARKNGEWSEVQDGADGAVRYDQSQSLTNTQKETARTNIGTIANNDSRLSDARTPRAHTHSTSEIMSNGMEFPYTLIPNCYIDSKSPGAEIPYSGWSATDYVDISGASKIKANPSFSSSGWNAFYDADKNWISAFSLSNGKDVNIPSNAKYIRVSNSTGAMNSLVLSSGETLAVTLKRKIEDAPKDGKQYARKDGAWTEVTGGGGGATDHSQLSNLDYEHAGHTGFQPTIGDLSTIRSGAEAGATAYQKPSTGIPKTDLASGVQSSLEKADSALQSVPSTYRTAAQQDVIDAQKTKTFVATITLDAQTGAISCDKTYAEIVAAHNAGYYVYALFSPEAGKVIKVPFGMVADDYLVFEGFSGFNGIFNAYGVVLSHEDIITKFWMCLDSVVLEVASLPSEGIMYDATYLISSGVNKGHFFKYRDGEWEDLTAIPSVPTISTNIESDKTSDTKTASPKAVYDFVKPSVGATIPSGGMLPNVLYNLGTITGRKTMTMASPSDSAIANHYFFTFNTSTTAPTITWDSKITSWYGGSAPTINASKRYEISVLNGVGICMEV